MKRTLTVVLLSLVAGSVVAAKPSDIDPSLTHLATQGSARLLVFSRCSPEHCWSEVALEEVAGSSAEPRVSCSTPLQEVVVGHLVLSAQAVPQGFELALASSHGGFEPYTVHVAPLGSCQYEFRRVVSGS